MSASTCFSYFEMKHAQSKGYVYALIHSKNMMARQKSHLCLLRCSLLSKGLRKVSNVSSCFYFLKII